MAQSGIVWKEAPPSAINILHAFLVKNDSGRDRFCASLFKGKWHRMGKKVCTVV
ncbi:hypothetical protein T4A_5932 [Trichinella pseudospiralis]|uniref:Uncharacterized protein n=1 Tax=Trichinella pseudospiralis TaxID=6337 RepID=A0A0V1C3I3_TRIPS|nr:hypothetical protein T4A_5932 [Trichinella pseudospiralis]